MIPKTKYQKKVVHLSEDIPHITEKQKQWGFESMSHFVFATKKFFTCMDCGHRWDRDTSINVNKNKYIVSCPHCGHKLSLWQYKMRTAKLDLFIQIATVFKGQQVFRTFYLTKYVKVLKPAELDIIEVNQHWISSTGDYAVIGRVFMRNWYGYYFNSSDWEIRKPQNKYHLNVRLCPGRKILKELKRNGYIADFYDYPPSLFSYHILKYPIFETLIKTGNHNLAKLFINHKGVITKYWNQIKYILRKDPFFFVDTAFYDWKDHMELLEYFKKDVRNPVFFYPKDLKAMHNRLSKKKHKILAKEREEAIRKAEAETIVKRKTDEWKYKVKKGIYFDIKIQGPGFYIEPLKSLDEFFEEGEYMHHCIFSNTYYNREKSLILSAKNDNGERLETIEFSLQDYTVIQSRGRFNEDSPLHDWIIESLNRNADIIKNKKYDSRRKRTHGNDAEIVKEFSEELQP